MKFSIIKKQTSGLTPVFIVVDDVEPSDDWGSYQTLLEAQERRAELEAKRDLTAQTEVS